MAEVELMQRTESESNSETELDLMQRSESELMLPSEPPKLLPGTKLEAIPTRSAALESTLNVEVKSILAAEPEAKSSLFDLQDQTIMMMAGAVLVGWLLRSISSKFSVKRRTDRLDRRSARIQSLESELRIALADARAVTEKPDDVISDQQELIVRLKKDLRYSIMKTRELRAELADRAVENAWSEVKLRQLESQLQVAQVSTNLGAFGMPDHSQGARTEKGRGKPFDRVDKLTRAGPPTIN